MKVTFEVEIDDVLVKELDYYVNYGEQHTPVDGCKKCVFLPMCTDWVDIVGEKFPAWMRDCKFPCWATKRDRLQGANRKVFVMNPNSIEK